MMENRKTSYLIITLTKLLKGERLSFIHGAKNSNQYFNIVKNYGIELIEVWKPNLLNSGKHKERRLNFTEDNVKLAQSYLERLRGTK